MASKKETLGGLGGLVLLIGGYLLLKGKPIISVKGDVNGDGKVSVADITHAEYIIMGLPNPSTGEAYTAEWIARADVNNDGSVDMGDVVRIENIMLGIES
ncbi:MAG: dockerin type I repeat-containing protein [Candidatus Marinimicrobia bacterium]|jgi:hypothetical protein|nr:dockerin type I repeat-containing protein [Candidatus Neomarinimicrobiota bacterium]